MAAEAFEIDLCILVGSTNADGRMTELVEIPVRRILLPEGIRLAIGEAGIAVGCQIRAPGKSGLTVRDKERPGARRPARTQVFVEQCPNGSREKHLPWTTAFAMDRDGAIWRGGVVDIDG